MLNIDKLAVSNIHSSTRTCGSFEYIIAVFALTFNNELVSFLYVLGLLSFSYSLKNFIMCIILPSSGLFITLCLKIIISRPRPSLYIPRFKTLIFDFRGREKNHSMPSGDSLQACTYWTMMIYMGVVPMHIGIVLTSITMFARIFYMCHYPTDTILGAILGILNFFMVNTTINYLFI